MCVGYGVGIGQTLIYANRWGQRVGQAALPAQFCAPDDFQPKETAGIMLEFLDAHPEDEAMDLAVLGNAALADRFPCGAPPPPGGVRLQPGFDLNTSAKPEF